MITLTKIFLAIKRQLLKLRLQPIRVFCLHHVCKTYDGITMYQGDWMQIDEFKQKVLRMRQDGVEFISLTDAYNKITNDKFRNHKCAVLTFDDGYASLKEILPWLEDQKIPATLFINGKYLDGKSYRNNPNEKYLNNEEVFELTSSLIEIGSHGWEHKRATEMTEGEFIESVARNIDLLQRHPNYIPFWAYTYGAHSGKTDDYLHRQGLVPIYVDGMKNYNETVIHRELL